MPATSANRSKRAGCRRSSVLLRRCGQAQERLAVAAEAKAAPVSPNPEPAPSWKAGPPCPRQEARHTECEPCTPHTPKSARPADKPGPSPPPSRPPLLASVAQTPTHRHQLNAVPPGQSSAAGTTAGPGPDNLAKIIPPLSARVRARTTASHTPCTVQQRAQPSTDAQMTKQTRPAQGPPAALPAAGPSRGGGRTRGETPSRALPPSSHRHARTPASDVHERSRPRTRPRRGRPRRWSCFWRFGGSGRRSVRAPAAQRLRKGIA